MPPAGETATWVDLIGGYLRDRRRYAELNPDVPLTMPHLAATVDQLDQAEKTLGRPLDPQYRALLQHGNGWPEMFLDIDLLSTAELGQSPAWDKAQSLLDVYFGAASVPRDFPGRDELIPIGVSRFQNDLLLLWTSGPVTDGGRRVSWHYPTGEVERYSCVREMFLDISRQLLAEIDELSRPG